MEETEVQALLREQLGLRIGREMASYIVRQLGTALDPSTAQSTIRIIAGDARTGLPLCVELPCERLRALATAPSSTLPVHHNTTA